MAARGQAGVGNRFVATSLIDSEFTVELTGLSEVGGRPAVLPRISGRGWVVGTRITAVDPTDPYQTGYVLSDLWGSDIAEAAAHLGRTSTP
jgi:proline racemase